MALRDEVGVDVRRRDFFGSDCANSLGLAQVGMQSELLVVDCAYAIVRSTHADAREVVSDAAETFKPKARRLRREAPRMDFAPDSIRFYVFEHASRSG